MNILLFHDETGTKFYPQLLLSANVALVKLNQCQRALKGLAKLLSDQSICAGGSTTDACSVSFIIESLLCDRQKISSVAQLIFIAGWQWRAFDDNREFLQFACYKIQSNWRRVMGFGMRHARHSRNLHQRATSFVVDSTSHKERYLQASLAEFFKMMNFNNSSRNIRLNIVTQ